jgi:hypothetical protein
MSCDATYQDLARLFVIHFEHGLHLRFKFLQTPRVQRDLDSFYREVLLTSSLGRTSANRAGFGLTNRTVARR